MIEINLNIKLEMPWDSADLIPPLRAVFGSLSVREFCNSACGELNWTNVHQNVISCSLAQSDPNLP